MKAADPHFPEILHPGYFVLFKSGRGSTYSYDFDLAGLKVRLVGAEDGRLAGHTPEHGEFMVEPGADMERLSDA